MSRITRRSFLAGTAAVVAAPAVSAPSLPTDIDVVIVGAGPAGIGAARQLAAAGRSFIVLEAADRIGGRCITDTAIFGVPFDQGAHWIHAPRINPVARLAPATGLDVYDAPTGHHIRIGRRNARTGELEIQLATMERANRAIENAARGKFDVSCAQALPNDLGPWQATVEFMLGPFGCGKDLDQISARDFARSLERDENAFCRQGYGTLLARLAEGLPIRLSTPVTRIDWGGRLTVETEAGRIEPRHVIVTASTEVLLSDRIAFTPALPASHREALGKLRLGSYDHIALELEGNPLGLGSDQLVFEQSSNRDTAAVLTNVSDTTLAMVEVAGRFGRKLSDQGETAMVEFGVEWLSGLFGSQVKRALGRSHATRWNHTPWIGGAFSAAEPGGQGARLTLAEPLRDRVFFAGEAAHETLWGTVGGAWASGESAAQATLALLSGAASKPAAKSKQKPRPAATSQQRGRPARPRPSQPRRSTPSHRVY